MNRIAALALLACILIATTACGPRSPLDRLQRAQEKAQAGDIQGAIEDVEQVRQMKLDDQTWAQATDFLGRLHAQIGNLEGARKAFVEIHERLGTQNPNPALEQVGQMAAVGVIHSYMQAQDMKTALAKLEETSATLKNAPEFSKGLTSLRGEILAALGKVDEGAQALVDVAELEQDPQVIVGLLVGASNFLAQAGRPDDAAQVFLNYLQRHPEFGSPLDLYVLAGISYSTEQPQSPENRQKLQALMDTALTLFDEELKKPEKQAERDRLFLGKATALRLVQRNTEAVDLLTSISQRQSFSPIVRASALYDIGRYHEEEGQFDQARQYYQKLAVDFPDYADRAGMALQMLSQREAQLAIQGGSTQPTQPASFPATQPMAATAPAASLPATAPVAGF